MGLSYRLLTLTPRPIPQWFRLKSDTKIQVRLILNPSTKYLDILMPFLLCSTMPNAAIGDEQSLTFKIDHIPRPHAGYGILAAEQGLLIDLGSNSRTYPCIFPGIGLWSSY
jgi:hypothetical protein